MFSKETPELDPKLPFPGPSFSLLKHHLYSQDSPAGTWGIVPQKAELLGCSLTPWWFVQDALGPPCSGKWLQSWQWVGARSFCWSFSSLTQSLHLVTASRCPDACRRLSPSVALIALKKKTVSGKVFFDVCSSPSPGAVRSDFDMKAQSFSDLSFFLPASLPPCVCILLENFRELGMHSSCDTKIEGSLGAVPWLLSPVQACTPWCCGFCGSVESLSSCPPAAGTSGSGSHCSCVNLHMVAQETPMEMPT